MPRCSQLRAFKWNHAHKYTTRRRERQVSKDWIKMVFKCSCRNAVHIKKFLEASDLKFTFILVLFRRQALYFQWENTQNNLTN